MDQLFTYPIALSVNGGSTATVRAPWVQSFPILDRNDVELVVLDQTLGTNEPGLYLWIDNAWHLALPYIQMTDSVIYGATLLVYYNVGATIPFALPGTTVEIYQNGEYLPGQTDISPAADRTWAVRLQPVTGSGVTSVNHKTPDSTGDVEIGISDIPGLASAITGVVKTINNIGADSNSNVSLNLHNLLDVNVTPGPGIDGYLLRYQNSTGQWVVESPSVFGTVKSVSTLGPDINGNVTIQATPAETVTPQSVTLINNGGQTTGDIKVKNIIGTGALTVTDNGTNLTMNVPSSITAVQATPSGAGYTTLVANDGTVTHVAQIKQLVAGVNVQFGTDGNSVTINATNNTGGGGTLTAVQSTGSGTSLVNYDGSAGSTIALMKSLSAGANITITPDAQNQTLTIASTTQTPPVTSVNGKTGAVVLTASDIGGFATVAYSGSYNDLLDKPSPYVLPIANTTTLGGVKVGANLAITSDGTLSATAIPLSPATTTTLGGVIVGSGLTVQADGTIAVSSPGGVTSVNNAVGALTLAGGIGVAVSTVGQTITISQGSDVGTVQSVALSMPSIFNVSGSPVTTTGTLTATLTGQNANTVFAGPSTGSANAPTFRALVPADLPVATSSTAGAVKVGSGLAVAGDGTISLLTSGLVTSFNGRSGAVNLTSTDVLNVGAAPLNSPNFTGSPTAGTPTTGDNSNKLATTAFVNTAISNAIGAASVTSWNGRTGAVVLQASDVTGVGGALLSSPAFTGVPTAPTATAGTNNTQIATTAFVQATVTGIVGVSSFNSRTGAVTLTSGDVSGAGAAMLDGAAFTGTVTAPTPASNDNSTKVATTEFVVSAINSLGVSSFNNRTGAVTLTGTDVLNAGGALLASPVFTGNPTAPTPTAGDSSTSIATTAFVGNAISSITAVPATTTTLGSVKISNGLTVTGDGTLSANVRTVAGRTGDIVLSVGDVSGAAPLNNAALTGVPTAPTAAQGTNTTQIATTAFVQGIIQGATSIALSNSNISLGANASYPIIQFTGTLTANVAVTTPTSGKWTFINSTSGAFTVTIRNGTGSTFVIPQGGTADLVSDSSLGILPTITSGITQPLNDNTNNLATTAFVIAQLGGQVAVQSWNGRTGAVTLQTSDVAAVGAAMLTGAAFTGAVTVPTPTLGDSSTNAATTAFVSRALLTVTSVPVSGANITLTAAQYNTETLRFTGTLTASITVTVPTAGQWMMYNNTTGAFNITLSNGQGSTYVVPQNQSAIVMSLGSLGVVNANIAGFTLTPATATTLGGVIVPSSGGLSVDASGNISVNKATSSTSGTVSQGSGITISSSGVISANVQTVAGQSPSGGNVALSVSNITGAAPLASPAFTGTPTAPTPANGDNSTAIATTAFVNNAVGSLGVSSFNTRTGAVTLQASDISGAGGALLASPAFTGTPTAPTATAGTNTNQIATTAFVTAAVTGVSGVATFNGRTGAVVLQASDVTGVGGALLASPTFTGTPSAPTATAGTNTTQLATTAFVRNAAAGVTSVTLSNANVTLTADQAAAPIIKLSGTLTANVTVIFPSSGWWQVYNTTTGSFTVTLSNNGVGVSVNIPQGQKLNLVSDSSLGMLTEGAASIARISVNISSSTNINSEVFYPVTNGLTLPANLVGSNAYGVAASGGTAPFTVNVYKYVGASSSGTQVGTITIVPGSPSTFSTVGGTSVSYAAGDRLSYQFPTANLSTFAATLLGTWQ